MKRFGWYLFLLSFLVVVTAGAQTDPSQFAESDTQPVLPDLTVQNVTARAAWVAAYARNGDFAGLLREDLNRIGREEQVGLYVKRMMPEVNYALIHVVNKAPVESMAGETDPGAVTDGSDVVPGDILPEPGGSGLYALWERIRRRLGELPYAEYCAYNPYDHPMPLPCDPMPLSSENGDSASAGIAVDSTFDTDHGILPIRSEIVPGDLVLILNGRPFPVLEFAAELDAGLVQWWGRVPVVFELLKREGSDPQTKTGIAYFRQGTAGVRCTFPICPGTYTCAVTVDPGNDVPEQDETNNSGRVEATVPELMMELCVGRVEMPEGDDVTVPGAIGIANFGEEKVAFATTDFEFMIDGNPVEPEWLHDGTNPAEPAPRETVALIVEPGRVAHHRFTIQTMLEPGEHALEAKLGTLGLYSAENFEVIVPQPRVNLLPAESAGRIEKITLKPGPDNPDVLAWVENQAWSAFSEQTILRHVDVHPGHRALSEPSQGTDSAPELTGAGEETREGTADRTGDDSGALTVVPDIVADFYFRPDVNTVPDLESLIMQLKELWFVADAFEMPLAILEDSVYSEGVGRDFTDDPALADPGVVLHRSVGIMIAPADPRGYFRVKIPVVLDGYYFDAADNVLRGVPEFLPVWPRFPTGVDFHPDHLMDTTTTGNSDAGDMVVPPFHAFVPLFSPGIKTAVGYIPAEVQPIGCRVVVDPLNKLAERDETDNVAYLQIQNEPDVVFKADARIERIPSIDSVDSNLPELDLIVKGTLFNRGTTTMSLTFSRALQMDFAWRDLYRWSDGRAFAQMFTTVEVAPADEHTWRIRAPLHELWEKIVLPGQAAAVAGMPLHIVLDVELAGTEFTDRVAVSLPQAKAALDEDNDLLPDNWENYFAEVLNGGGPAEFDPVTDPDGDGWNNLLEFANNTDPLDPGSVPPGRLFYLTMEPGWNLISLPVVIPGTDAVQDVFGELIQGPAFEYVTGDSGDRSGAYREVETLQPHTAYWVYATETVEAEIPGVPHTVEHVRIERGWSLSGEGGPLVLPENVSDATAVWGWSAERQCYEQTLGGRLEEGQGYWISAPREYELDLKQ